MQRDDDDAAEIQMQEEDSVRVKECAVTLIKEVTE